MRVARGRKEKAMEKWGNSKQRLIDIFVNSVYLYDGYAVITYNYKDGTKTITLDEVEGTEDGSYLSAFGVPVGVFL